MVVSMLVWAGISMLIDFLFISNGLPIKVEARTGVKDLELMWHVEAMMREHRDARIQAVRGLMKHEAVRELMEQEELLGESLKSYYPGDRYVDRIFWESEYVPYNTEKFAPL